MAIDEAHSEGNDSVRSVFIDGTPLLCRLDILENLPMSLIMRLSAI
jgi:hypothetical protein